MNALIVALVVIVAALLVRWCAQSLIEVAVVANADGVRLEAVPTDRALELAAMHALWPLPRVIPGPWEITQGEIDRARRRVDELNAWVNSATELSERERAAYRHWLTFCANDNARAQVSLDTNEAKRFNDKWNADRKRDAELVRSAKIHRPPTR